MRAPNYVIVLIALVILVVHVTGNPIDDHAETQHPAITVADRIDCYPEAEAKFSGFSKTACLARNCLFDDAAGPGGIPCYFPPNYGYRLQGTEQQTPNGIRLRLKRNQAIKSPFPEPIENVLLDVQYYTNDIIRFKLCDADNQRYEVRL